MGERRYKVNDIKFQFSDSDEGEYWTCLCTFPHNDECFGEISKGRIASLALLGVATALGIYEPEKINKYHKDYEDAYLPECIPFWIKKQIYEQMFEEDYSFGEDGYLLKCANSNGE